MRKTFKTPSGKEVTLSSSAAFLLVYRRQFGEKALQGLQELISGKFTDLSLFYNFAWSLYACANYDNYLDPMAFYTTYDDFLPMDHADEIAEMITASMITVKDTKAYAKNVEKPQDKMTSKK